MNLAEKDFRYIIHPFTVFDSQKRNIPVVSGKGACLFDENGNKYIDANSSWWVNLHGHAHPYINQKIKEQLDKLEHVIFAGLTHEPAVNLAEKLFSVLPENQHKIFFSDNGSTAVEVALKLSIQFYKNQGKTRNSFVAFRNSYHGDTFGAMSVSERDIFVSPFIDQLFTVNYIPLPDTQNIEEVKTLLTRILKQNNTAAFIFEPLVQGAAGMRMYDSELLDELIEICHQHEVLCIADEVMTGFGRTETLFASDPLKNKPDIMCFSKGISGGYLPLGVSSASQKVFEAFEHTDSQKAFYHGHSFTGNPLSCAAAEASLDLLMHEDCHQSRMRINEMHKNFAKELSKNDLFTEVRVRGNIIAADLLTSNEGYFYTNPIKEKIYTYFLKNGILIRPLGNVIYCNPPYCIQNEDLERIYWVWNHINKQL